MSAELPRQPLVEHLIELRRRLILCLLTFFAATILCYGFAGEIYAFLVRPLAEAFADPTHRRLIYTGLTEAFMAYLRLAVFAGFFISFPVIATQPSARRRGLAPALLEAIRQRAHDDGKEVMLLTQCTERAEGTYARAGYRTVYQTELVYRDGERDPWFVMVR